MRCWAPWLHFWERPTHPYPQPPPVLAASTLALLAVPGVQDPPNTQLPAVLKRLPAQSDVYRGASSE